MITQATITGKNYDPRLYHSSERIKRGDPRYIMSYSALKQFGTNPSRWVRGYKSPDSPAKDWGNLLDCIMLTPDKLGDKFAVKPDEYTDDKGNVKPWNGNANVCKAWKEDVEANGLTPISADMLAGANEAMRRMMDTPQISEYVSGSEKQIAVEGVWSDLETKTEFPIRCLIDLAPTFESPYANTLGDLKSSRCANPEIFVNQIFSLNYHIQAALYLALWNKATGDGRTGWNWVVSESFPPYEPCAIEASPDMITLGQQTMNRLMGEYAKCLKTQVWPGYKSQEQIEGWNVVYPKPWMMSQEFFADESEKELPF